MRFLLWLGCCCCCCCCLPLTAADVFSGQHAELEQYHLGEIRRAVAAGGNRPRLLAERLGTVAPLARPQASRTLLAVWPDARIEELRVEAEPGHFAHALLLTPAAPSGKLMIAMGPADRAAETWAGLAGSARPAAWLSSLLVAGYTVCLPIAVQRTKDHPMSESTRGKDRRHILHRLGFVTGRTVTGLEVTEIRGLAAYLYREGAGAGLYGEKDGAWTALNAAAADPGRFSSLNLVDPPVVDENAWREPVDRILFGQLSDLGAPKPPHQPVAIPPARRPLRSGEPLLGAEIDERRNRHFNELVDYLRSRIRRSAAVRRARHNLLTTPPQQAVPKLLADLRAVMGEIPRAAGNMNARLTEAGRGPRFTAYDVRLDVLPGVEVYGQLLTPHGAAQAGKKLPAVVTQHGLGGKPKDLTLQGPEPNAAYHGYAARLAEHGYVVFAPYVVVPIPQAELINPLVRMANLIGRMRTNIEVTRLRRIVDFLESLPYVDARKLGYYGLSYGGYSAIWMGPLEPRFQATVVSGHFNDWTPKITNEAERTSYLQHPDEDFYNWDVLNRLTHVELLASFWPRAVMVEFAQHDGTTFPAWHETAWAEVRRVAQAWNATDRIVRDRFAGVHEIHGIGAFDFLDRWLRPEEPSSRAFEHWGPAVTHIIEAGNPLTWVGGGFRVGSRDPSFRGLAFRATGAGKLTVRYGLTPGGIELGQTEARMTSDGWARAPVPRRTLDPARQYWFELRLEQAGEVTLAGPKPLGGVRFPGEFAPGYRPIDD